MEPRRSRRRKLATVGLVLGSLAAGLLVGELVFRRLEPAPVLSDEVILDRRKEDAALFAPAPPPLLFVPVPGRSAVPGTMNALGLRDREYPEHKAAGTFRILVLGDSITWGSGIPQDTTFENLLEDRLTAGGLPVEILNLGVPGYNAIMMEAYLAWRGLSLAPDLVLAVIGLNDESATPVVLWEEAQARFRWYDTTRSDDVPWLLRLPWGLDRRLMRGSALYRGLCRRLGSADAPRYRRLQEENREALLGIADLARRHGAAVGFVLLPELEDFSSYPRQAEHDALAAWLVGHGEVVIDLLPGLRRATDGRGATLRFSTQDPLHPNQVGNELIATLLRAALPVRGLLALPVPAAGR